MDNTHLQKILKIKAGQRLTSEERMESLKNNLTFIEKMREEQIAQKKILDDTTAKIEKLHNEVKNITAKMIVDNKIVSKYWHQVAIERQEFNDKFNKIMNELRNRDCGNSQSQ